MNTEPDNVQPAPIEVSGQLLYRDGTPAAGVPYELKLDGQSRVGTTRDDGRFELEAPGSLGAVNLSTLDGFGVGLASDLDTVGSATVRVPVKSGRMDTAYVLGVPKAMVLVSVPTSPSEQARQAIVDLDLVGSHEQGQLITMLAPEDLPGLRALGVEVLVLDPDANAYAAQTGEMTEAERRRYIDDRIAAARAQLARLDP